MPGQFDKPTTPYICNNIALIFYYTVVLIFIDNAVKQSLNGFLTYNLDRVCIVYRDTRSSANSSINR